VTSGEQRITVDGEQWVWVCDGTAAPAPDALDRLLERLGRLDGLPAPVLLTSKIVDAAGALVPDLAPWPRRDDPALALDAATRGLLPVRATHAASVLVLADVLDRRPHTPAAALEWTARILRDATGYLVPDSVAVAGPAARGASLRARGALLVGPAFAPAEKPALALELMSRAAGAGRRALRAPAPRRSPR
jgi:hypothetical protein